MDMFVVFLIFLGAALSGYWIALDFIRKSIDKRGYFVIRDKVFYATIKRNIQQGGSYVQAF